MLAILFFVLLIAYADRVNASILIADESFLRDLGLQGKPVALGMIMTLFLLPYALANMLFSPLGDVFGPRKVMTVATAAWAPAMALGGLSPSVAVLFASRILLGLAEGVHWPMQSKYVGNWFEPEKRARANSLWLMGLILGPAFSMRFLVWLIQSAGWRASFFTLALINVIPVILLWFCTADAPSGIKRAGMGQAAATQPLSLSLRAYYKQIITDYRFWLVTFFSFCHASMWWGTIAWLPTYLKNTQGFSWGNTGTWASLPYFAGAIAAVLIGYFSDRLKRRGIFAVLSLLGSVAGILASLFSTSQFYAAFFITGSITSLAAGLPIIWTMLQGILPGQASGAGAGLMNGLANGGAAFAPVMVGLFINWLGNFKGGFMYLALMGLLGVAAMLPLLRESR
ncbi:MAG TPA: MFS transporter [Methylomusa anaerophila]|uniref:MFS transporter n=1 Tax=Methylomusa anaerophila TaxID=1930071 RepID=UPI00131579D6|nr:MFS transporter [Methylomusa anaerophila]HML88167.1 MFS transporter [Methylomusa anaerophila]